MKKVIFISILALLFAWQVVLGEIPKTMSYQGVLTDPGGIPVPDNTYSITFRLYAVSTGGSFIWQESQSVAVSKGVFNVILGKTAPFDTLQFAKPYWLGITVAPDPEMTPRVELTSAPYSLNSLGGGGSTGCGWTDDGTVVRLNTSSDRVGIGTTVPTGQLEVKTNHRHAGYFTSDSTSDSTEVVHAEFTGTGSENAVAVYGKSTPGEGYGYGGHFIGGQYGVHGEAMPSSLGSSYGVYGDVQGDGAWKYGVMGETSGSGENYGVHGFASGNENAVYNYGIYGAATGGYTGSATNYGVYGKAWGAGINWAGYFDGDLFTKGFKMPTGAGAGKVLTSDANGVGTWQAASGGGGWTDDGTVVRLTTGSDRVSIGTETPEAKLHVQLNEDNKGGFFWRDTYGYLYSVVYAQTDSAVIGVYGNSGNIGVMGVGKNEGIFGEAWSNPFGSDSVYAVKGRAGGSGKNYGLYGVADGTGINYSVYGAGSTYGIENWAGYFDGNTYVGDSLGIGTKIPETALHVNGEITIQNDPSTTSFIGGSGFPKIYNSSAGGSYPFSANGNLIIQPRTSGHRDIVFATGYGTPTSRMVIKENGNIGIGNNYPGNILTVQQNSATDPIADAWTTYSSRRWKTNIKTIENPLDKVKRLRGVTYDWKANGKHDIGLIAEEVGEVIPEVVAYEENGVDAKSVDYARLVAVLIEAVKAQQKEIDELKREMKRFSSRPVERESDNLSAKVK